MDVAYLVPVKAFHLAKQRLRGHIPDTDRVRLARWMADGVVDALDGHPVFVACDDDAVAEWARTRSATVLWGPGLGLNGAVDAGVNTIAAAGYDHVTICHGDLPLPHSLTQIAIANTIVLVPDRRNDGTNVLSRPTGIDFPARYGSNSFHRHLDQARVSGYDVVVHHDDGLALDLDTIEDGHDPVIEPLIRDLLGHTGIGEP